MHINTLIYLEPLDCGECISKFVNAAGCDCIKNNYCEISVIFSAFDCLSCKNESIANCSSLKGSCYMLCLNIFMII